MSRVSFAKAYAETLADILEAYRATHGRAAFSMLDAAEWAIKHDHWRQQKKDPATELAKHLSRVAKLQVHRDKQGRKVRSMHAAKYPKVQPNGQMTFYVVWDHIDTMSDDHAQVSFSQRHEQWVGAGKSLKNDEDSFYDNNPNAGPRVQRTFNIELLLEDVVPQATEAITPDAPVSADPKKPR